MNDRLHTISIFQNSRIPAAGCITFHGDLECCLHLSCMESWSSKTHITAERIYEIEEQLDSRKTRNIHNPGESRVFLQNIIEPVLLDVQ